MLGSPVETRLEMHEGDHMRKLLLRRRRSTPRGAKVKDLALKLTRELVSPCATWRTLADKAIVGPPDGK